MGNNNSVPKNDKLAGLKTGDLLLSSANSFTSCLIRCGTCSLYSHAGIIVKIDNDIYVAHATDDFYTNIQDEKLYKDCERLFPNLPTERAGVILIPLDDLDANKITIYKNKHNLANSDFLEFYVNFANKKYSYYKQLVYSGIDIYLGDDDLNHGIEDPEHIFCSDLVVLMLKYFSWINTKNPACEFTQEDLLEFPTVFDYDNPINL
jgi:hypothetical protein